MQLYALKINPNYWIKSRQYILVKFTGYYTVFDVLKCGII